MAGSHPIICYPNLISSDGIYSGDSPFDFSVPLLLFQLSLIIIISNIVRFVLRPLKQPTFVCDSIGAILIGPSGLGRSKTFANTMYPPRSLHILNVGASIGTIYYLFLIGVKQDAKVIVNSGRKAWVITIAGIIIPLIAFTVIILIAPSMNQIVVPHTKLLIILALNLSLNTFASVHPILAELNLLNSKLGRLAMSASTNNNVAGWPILAVFGAVKVHSTSPFKALCYMISFTVFLFIIFFVIRPMMFWIIRRTPEGRPVDRAYIVAILLGVFIIGFLGDFIGISSSTGTLIFGLAIPDGPPLGAAIVEKVETIVQWLYLPFIYTTIGLKVNVFDFEDWTTLITLLSIVIISILAKLVGTILPCRYFKIPFYDTLALALIMNIRGLVELIIYLHLDDYKIMDDQQYTSMVILTVIVMAIVTPLVRSFSQHSKPYTPYGVRTIEHLKPYAELGILVCTHTEQNVPTMINILEASNATRESPIRACVLNLVELVGRATPMFISHNLHRQSHFSSTMPHIKHINNAFQKYEQQKGRRWVSIQSFTTVSPYKTIHQDICMLALDKKSSLIIVPFRERRSINTRTNATVVDQQLRTLNSNVLAETPCSVGILVDHGCQFSNFFASSNSWYHICLIFLGGADDREALSYGFRMASHPRVRLDVVRILPMDDDDDDKDNDKRYLDDRLVDLLRFKCTGNQHVDYREERVNYSEETINIIRSMKNQYHLMIVGRRHDNNSILVEGLSQWCENPELGVIGDFLASSDFYRGTVSVLVLQQQINVGLVASNASDLNAARLKSPFVAAFQ